MTNNGTEENTLAAQVKISKFPLSAAKYYKLDKNLDWTKALLDELNEKAEGKSAEEFFESGHLNITLELHKKFKQEYGEYLLVSGHLETAYVTQCVRTLEDVNDSLELDFKACFLDESLEGDEAFADQDEIFEKDSMYELYFYKKGMADIAEMIHEQVYLNINQYPVKDADSPLPWGNEGPSTKQ